MREGACCLVLFSSLGDRGRQCRFRISLSVNCILRRFHYQSGGPDPHKVATELMLTGAHMKVQRAYRIGITPSFRWHSATRPLTSTLASLSKARRSCSDYMRLSTARRFCRAAHRRYKPSAGAVCCAQNPDAREGGGAIAESGAALQEC